MERWKDGRSGESGRFVGNLVLNHLDPSGKEIAHHKGTVFVDRRHCWIGRVVGDDGYLTTGVEHWANISADQHRDLTRFSSDTNRALMYLFITAHPESKLIRCWKVPASVLERELNRRGKIGHGAVLGLHISDRMSRHMLGEEDVTDCFVEFSIDSASSTQLASAVHRDRKKAPVSRAPSAVSPPSVSVKPWSGTQVRNFDIPLSAGRIATLSAPVPMTAQDIIRIKGYIDLMSDLLAPDLP